MELRKEIMIDGMPLSFHRVVLCEIDIQLAIVRLTVRSWFSKEAADSGTPPHRVHTLHSEGDSTEIATVVQRVLLNSPLQDAELVLPTQQ